MDELTAVKQDIGRSIGEKIIAHYLVWKGAYPIVVGGEKHPFDIIISKPDGNMFKKKSVIQVKSETECLEAGTPKKIGKKFGMWPEWSDFKRMREKINSSGFKDYTLYIGLVLISWGMDTLRCKGLIISEDEIREDMFIRKEKTEFLDFMKAWGEAKIKFESKGL